MGRKFHTYASMDGIDVEIASVNERCLGRAQAREQTLGYKYFL